MHQCDGTAVINGAGTAHTVPLKIWTLEPNRFILNPIHQMPGLNNSGVHMHDFFLTDEDRAFRAEVRAFLSHHLKPRVDAIERDQDFYAQLDVVRRKVARQGISHSCFAISTRVG